VREAGEGANVMPKSMASLPHPNPLMELLAIRLGRQKTPAKSLVIPQAGEGANVMPK
jgi:hypothetical protein